MDPSGARPAQDPARLAERLARERRARSQAEGIAEHVTRELYQAHELVHTQFRTSLRALSVLSQVTGAALDVSSVGQAIADGCTALFGAAIAQVWMDDPAARALRPAATAALDAAMYEAVGEAQILPHRHSLGGTAFGSREAIFVRDVRQDPRWAHPRLAERLGLRACAVLPLTTSDKALGVLFIMFRAEREFSSEDKELMGLLAGYATISLQRARLVEELERSYAHLQEAQARLVQVQKMEAISRVAGGLAHDFNSLLAIIVGRAELQQSRLAPETAAHGDAIVICQAAESGAAITRQLLDFAHRRPVQLRALDIKAMVTRLVPMLRPVLGQQIELRVFVPGPEPCRVKADQAQLEEVLVNLVLNARDAMPAGGPLTIAAENAAERARGHLGKGPGRYVRLVVADTGTGMDETTRARAFEPFFTTKEAGAGVGLGLASVYGIVEQHGGHIDLDTAIGRGTTVTIWLPALDEAATEEASLAPPAVLVGGPEVILLAEDEGEFRRLVEEALNTLGYSVLSASTPGQALGIATRHGGPIDLLLTDMLMPELNGPELARRIQYLRPGIKVLYMSGYPDEVLRIAEPRMARRDVLQKPFRLDALARAVRAVLDESVSG